jgi:uncharacterized sulfatase
MLAEGVMLVPFVIAFPGKIPGGQTFEHPVGTLDVAGTAVKVAAASAASDSAKAEATLDGVNLIPPPHPR